MIYRFGVVFSQHFKNESEKLVILKTKMKKIKKMKITVGVDFEGIKKTRISL